MNNPNYNVGGVNLTLEDFQRLARLKRLQEEEGLPDDLLRSAASGRMFKLDTDPMGGMDLDRAIGFKSKIRKK